MKKRLVALALAVVMMLMLVACSNKGATETATSDPLTKDDVIDITILSHASWPYDENWKVWDYIEEGVGATLNINAIPSADATTKYPLMFSSPDTLPDVITFDYKPDSDKYAIQGAFVALDDMTEYMPNYTAWLDSLTEEQKEAVVDVRKAFDGKVYYAPATGREANRGIRAWLYRKDVFDANGLAVPTNFDELYNVCKQLKAIYPESFPFGMRAGISNIGITGSSWKEWWEPGVYYNHNTGEWSYGATEPILKDVLEFYRKMVDEKLIPSDFMTINAQTWQELVTTDRAFIFPDYQTRITFFNSMVRSASPDTKFNLTAMVPPVATSEGKPAVTTHNYEALGYAICNTRNEKTIANAAKFLDWFYTDEAMELVSWGKEGETYNIVDGKKQYIIPEAGGQTSTLYGFTTHGTFLRFDPEATIAAFDEDTLAVKDMVAEHTLNKFNPVVYLAFNDEESKVIEELQTALKSFSEEKISKYILGQEPLSSFDAFVSDLNDMGVDKLLAVYESAYNRIK